MYALCHHILEIFEIKGLIFLFVKWHMWPFNTCTAMLYFYTYPLYTALLVSSF